jgi:hypothetical protein
MRVAWLTTRVLYGPECRSWASVELLDAVLPGRACPTAPPVRRGRVRAPLVGAGEPGIGDWLVTVTPTGHTITLEPVS